MKDSCRGNFSDILLKEREEISHVVEGQNLPLANESQDRLVDEKSAITLVLKFVLSQKALAVFVISLSLMILEWGGRYAS